MQLLELPFEPASASVARRHIVNALRARAVAAVTYEDAALIVSELVGNALRHGRAMRGGRLRVGWEFGDEGLRLEVTDGGDGVPLLRPGVDALASNGRGLEIVASVAEAWGFASEPEGTVVWARLSHDLGAQRRKRERSKAAAAMTTEAASA